MKICRICLAINVEGTPLADIRLARFIQNILKFNGYRQQIYVHHFACFECKAYIVKSYKFIQRVLRAQTVLCSITKEDNKVSKDVLKKLDRKLYALTTNFAIEKLFDININEEKISNPTRTIGIEAKIQVNEDDVITEVVDAVEDGDDGDENTEAADPITDIDVQKETQIEWEKEVCIDDVVQEEIVVTTDQLANVTAMPHIITDSLLDSNKKTDISNNETVRNSVLSDNNASLKSADTGSHIKKCKDNREYPRKCDHCDFEIQGGPDARRRHYRHYLKHHTREQYPYRREVYVCKVCGVSFGNKYNYNDHMLTHGERTFKCQRCLRLFHNRPRLLGHMRRVHTNPEYVCVYCNYSRKTEYAVRIHMFTCKNKVERQYPRKCDHCDFVIPLGRYHYNHYLHCHTLEQYPYRHKEPLFECEICGAQLLSKYTYRNHLLRHSEKTVKCQKCTRLFHNQARLLVHMRNVHKEK